MAVVYIETTIPSYYFESRRTAQAVAWHDATRKWWDLYRPRYELVTSRFVLAELSLAPASKAKNLLALTEYMFKTNPANWKPSRDSMWKIMECPLRPPVMPIIWRWLRCTGSTSCSRGTVVTSQTRTK